MHDAPKRFNELEGDFKKSSIGEYANRGEAADQINQTASNAGERPIACIIQVLQKHRAEIEKSGNSLLREQLYLATGETDKLHEERRKRAEGIRIERMGS